MTSVLKAAKPFGVLLLTGILQRIGVVFICGDIFNSLWEEFISCGQGLVFDLSFISVLFLVYFLFSTLINRTLAIIVYYTFISLWVILNTSDIFTLTYLRARTNLNTFNLFNFHDLSDKAGSSVVLIPAIAYFIVFTSLFIFLRKKIIPFVSSASFKENFLTLVLLVAGTLFYLPYPLNYYTDQTTISKEAKQLSLNPYFNWFTSVYNSYDAYSMNSGIALFNFKKQLDLPDTSGNTLSRNVYYTDSAYNSVILVVMESFGANRIGALHGSKDLSPNFNALCKEGTLYTKCFSCGPRTQYGISSILFGFPHILGYNLFRHNKLKLSFKGLPSLLKANNYNTHFIHGGDATYDDMNLLLKADAPISIKDMKDIIPYQFKNKWGVDDESLFDYSARYIHEGKNFYCILSMSNHEPFQVPSGYKTDDSLLPAEKTFLYSDYALGRFIKKLKELKQFQRSLIIITADHGERYDEKDVETKLYHVPLLIIDHKNKGVTDTFITSHIDIAEYILSKTAFKGQSHLIGRGLLPNNNSEVYYRNYNDDIYKVTDSIIYRYNLLNNSLYKISVGPSLYEKGCRESKIKNEKKRVTEQIQSFYTASRFIFENGLYQTY
ncbi:MAG: hypothetical protein JWO32_770 [Bacteroidetes bacterium]|nr:hypothetical protein [Bacteroidota bacterium]